MQPQGNGCSLPTRSDVGTKDFNLGTEPLLCSLQGACPLVGHVHIRERRKNNLCCCSCYHHQCYKCSYVSEETFLLWGLYVPRVKSKPAARESPFHDNCFSLPSISEPGQEHHLKTRGFVLIVTEAPGDVTGYRWLHTSRGALRLCLPSCVAPRPCSTCLAK